jgi:antitoxin ParD1/3/4
MTTMNVSLPDTLKDFVDQQVDRRGYSTSSEYVRDLIRRDQVAQGERELAALLREGVESGAAVPVGKGHWDRKKAELRKSA